MNSTLCITTDAALTNCTSEIATALQEDSYDTAPVAAVLPPYQSASEEELHTSFEQAISGRLIALQSQLERISDPQLYTPRYTNPIRSSRPSRKRVTSVRKHVHPSSFGTTWQRSIIVVGLALMFIMVGFDLMGLLMLHTLH